jgi:hypothetical protein
MAAGAARARLALAQSARELQCQLLARGCDGGRQAGARHDPRDRFRFRQSPRGRDGVPQLGPGESGRLDEVLESRLGSLEVGGHVCFRTSTPRLDVM